MDKWEGVISTDTVKQQPLSIKNLILKGSILMNTDFLVGLVIYVGNDTKIDQKSS